MKPPTLMQSAPLFIGLDIKRVENAFKKKNKFL